MWSPMEAKIPTIPAILGSRRVKIYLIYLLPTTGEYGNAVTRQFKRNKEIHLDQHHVNFLKRVCDSNLIEWLELKQT